MHYQRIVYEIQSRREKPIVHSQILPDRLWMLAVRVISYISFAKNQRIHTALSGNVFAVEFTELAKPPELPTPVRKLQKLSVQKTMAGADDASGARPESQIYLMPEYPLRRNTKLHARSMRGPRVSTIRPHNGPELLAPTEKRQPVGAGMLETPHHFQLARQCSTAYEISSAVFLVVANTLQK